MASFNYALLLMDQLEPAMREAFLDAVAALTDDVVVAELEARLGAGDLDGAIAVLRIEGVVFSSVADRLEEAFRAAGEAAAQGASSGRVRVVFDSRDYKTADWLRTESMKLVRGLSRTATKTARTVLSSGMAAGRNPRATALDLVGRVSRTTNRRTGGLLGLTPTQASWVMNARDELTSEDPATMRRYLGRLARDKRLDGVVKRALRDGKKIDPKDVDRLVGMYSDRLLKLRGETIARTETHRAVHSGQTDAMRQAVESGKIAYGAIKKIWHDSHDSRVRFTHRAMRRQAVGLNEKFLSPSGALIDFPGDPEAPTAETVMCRCWMEIKVNHLWGL